MSYSWFNNWTLSSFIPLSWDKTCSPGIFICQNSHLQLRIKAGTISLEIIKRLLAIFLIYSVSRIKPSFHFEVVFSYVLFLLGQHIPNTNILTLFNILNYSMILKYYNIV